jgi:hypothetical protein
MTECKRCGGRAELFLCWDCGKDIRHLLTGKPVERRHGDVAGYDEQPGIVWYLDKLSEAAYRQTRLGQGSGCRKTKPASESDLLPDKRASALRQQIHNMLSLWVRAITETRGLTFAPLHTVEPGFVGPLRAGWRRLGERYAASGADMAIWLSHHITAVMSEPDAHVLYADLRRASLEAARLINRPPELYLGLCQQPRLDDDDNEIPCGTPIRADYDADDVQCGRCKTSYEVESLKTALLSQIEAMLFTGPDLLRILAVIGEPIPRSTWYGSDGRPGVRYRVQPRGWAGDEPMYVYSDVRAAMARTDETEPVTHRRRERVRRSA